MKDLSSGLVARIADMMAAMGAEPRLRVLKPGGRLAVSDVVVRGAAGGRPGRGLRRQGPAGLRRGDRPAARRAAP